MAADAFACINYPSMNMDSTNSASPASPGELSSSLTTSSTLPIEPSAIRDGASHARLWIVAVLGLAADLLSKHWAFTHLPANGQSKVIVNGLMSFQRSLNPGALFGLGKGLTPVFIGASVVALGFVLFLFYHSTRRRRSLHIALGLVLAGALGNMYDRAFMIADIVKFTQNGQTVGRIGKIVNPGETPMRLGSWPQGDHPEPVWPEQVRQMGVVRDFIKLEPRLTIAGKSRDLWPWVFNMADMWLVIGVSILMINFWWDRRQEKAAEVAAAVAAKSTQEHGQAE